MTRRSVPCCKTTRPYPWIATPKVVLTDEEKHLGESLAKDLNRITALIGGQPSRCPPESSMAASLLARLRRLGESSQQRIIEIARKSGLPEQTGSAAGDNLEPGLARELKRLLRKRLNTLKPQLRAAIDGAVSAARQQAGRASLTTVDLKLAGEIDTTWRREINMGTPELLDFRWSTVEPDATRGFWELRGPVWLGLGNPGNVIASGYLPDFPNDNKVGGYFTLAFNQYLPPTPPQAATLYHLRVLPLGPAASAGLAQSSGFDFSLQENLGTLSPVSGYEAPIGVGPWSAPAVIRYGTTFQSGITVFPDDMNRTVYRKAHFYFDWFKLVQDQSGPGNEEFHISGFVVEHNPQGAVQHASIGPLWFQIDPDDRSLHEFGKHATVNLGTPNYTYWPRVLTAVISILEEDDGGSLSDWQAALDELLYDLLFNQAGADINAFLREMRDEIKQAQEELAAEMTAEMISFLLAAIAATAREYVTAFIALVVGWVLAAIKAGAADDFYGTKVLSMFLETSATDRIADGTAGDLECNGPVVSGGNFTGTVQPDGSFSMDLTEIQFLGLGGAEEGSPISGIVNIALHWEFDDKVWV